MPESDRRLRLALLTAGDPTQRTGGYLYQQRMAQAAPLHGAEIVFKAIPSRALPLATIEVPGLLRQVRGYDAILLDSIAAAASAPWLRGGIPPVIGLLHQVPGGVDHGRLRRAMQSRLDRFAYDRCRALIVVSDYLARCLIASDVDSQRISVVPPGRDLAGSAPSPAVDLRLGRRAALLCVSNWLPNKGIHLLLQALSQLPDTTATLHLVGNDRVDPGYAKRLRQRLAAPDLRSRVVVHGSLEAPAVASLYAGADLFMLPSLREAYGTACGEAMAAGLPVVAFNVDNLPYLVRDGIDGILAPPGDVPALAAAIERLCRELKTRRRMGEAAKERALTWPTWQQSADRFFAAIQGYLSPSPLAREGNR